MTLPDLSRPWWEWIAPASLHAAMLALAVLVVDRTVLRNRSPRLLAVLWSLPLLRLAVPLEWSSPVVLLPPAVGAAVSAAPPPEGAGPGDWLFPIWLTGVVGFLLLALAARRRQHRRYLGGASRPVPGWLRELCAESSRALGLPRVPALRVQAGAPGPAVVGNLRPVVVMPAGMTGDGPGEAVRHVLLHELAHVRRCDPQIGLAVTLLQVLFWFHPATWVCSRRLGLLRELACDRAAVRVLGSARSYRRTLMAISAPVLRPGPAPAFLRSHGQLLQRLLALKGVPRDARWRRRLATVAWAGLLLVCCAPPAVPRSPMPGDPADLQGCLQLRFYVHGLLAQKADAAPDK